MSVPLDDIAGYVFTPDAQVTVQELAGILQVMLKCQQASFAVEMFEQMPDACKRHFAPVTKVSEALLLRTLV